MSGPQAQRRYYGCDRGLYSDNSLQRNSTGELLSNAPREVPLRTAVDRVSLKDFVGTADGVETDTRFDKNTDGKGMYEAYLWLSSRRIGRRNISYYD